MKIDFDMWMNFMLVWWKIKLVIANISWKCFYSVKEYCNDFLDLKNITNDMICADILEEGSFCIGDGGGPLVTKNKIVSKQYSLEKNL